MTLKKISLGLCLVGIVSITAFSQQPITKDTVKREVLIHIKADDNKINFSTTTPALQQIQGAPKAFYEYYWEFGDGEFSHEPTPTHIYKKEGDHSIRQWTTNNYDNGKPPPSRPQKVSVKKITYNAPEQTPSIETEIFRLKNIREPVPDEDMVVIVSYKNEAVYPASGKLYLFYNEKKFKVNNFSLLEVRTHHAERIVEDLPTVAAASLSPLILLNSSSLWATTGGETWATEIKSNETPSLDATLLEGRSNFKNTHLIEFDDMQAGEQRNIFYSFKTTPEMLKDTSAVIKIKGVYVPERGTDKHHTRELEMEIVTSHDPNKMSAYDTRLNFRFYKKRENGFKIRFQNNGEGPARSIKLQTDVPAMFDKHSLKIINVYPPCPVCPDGEEVPYSCIDTLFSKDQITFHFKNIYLPGTNQDHVKERDSTKGFVQYTLRFNDHILKEKTVSRTAIIFDKNEPVITNFAHTRFKPGLSIGVKTGYNSFPGHFESRSFFVGATISSYKALHGYFQAELMMGVHNYSDSINYQVDTQVPGIMDFYNQRVVSQEKATRNIDLYIVPISYCYTINKFIGISSGIQLTTHASGNTKSTALIEFYQYDGRQNIRRHLTDRDFIYATEEKTKAFSAIDPGIFAGIVVGSARIGPTLGARYVYNFNDIHDQWHFYALWKF